MIKSVALAVLAVALFVCFDSPLAFADAITIELSPPGPGQYIIGVEGTTEWQRVSPTQVVLNGSCEDTSESILGFIPAGSSVTCQGFGGFTGAASGTVYILQDGTIDPVTGVGEVAAVFNYSETSSYTKESDCIIDVITIETCYENVFEFTTIFSLVEGPPQFATGTAESQSAADYGVSVQTPMPEPSSVALLGTGLFCLGGIFRRKRLLNRVAPGRARQFC